MLCASVKNHSLTTLTFVFDLMVWYIFGFVLLSFERYLSSRQMCYWFSKCFFRFLNYVLNLLLDASDPAVEVVHASVQLHLGCAIWTEGPFRLIHFPYFISLLSQKHTFLFLHLTFLLINEQCLCIFSNSTITYFHY